MTIQYQSLCCTFNLTLAVLAVTISACGGGGGGSPSNDSEQEPDTDIFELKEFSITSLVDSDPNDKTFEINTGMGKGSGRSGYYFLVFLVCNSLRNFRHDPLQHAPVSE